MMMKMKIKKDKKEKMRNISIKKIMIHQKYFICLLLQVKSYKYFLRIYRIHRFKTIFVSSLHSKSSIKKQSYPIYLISLTLIHNSRPNVFESLENINLEIL